MIKTSVNRHDLEYFLYAMARAFYKDARVLPPDTATHNMPEDDEADSEDVLCCHISDNAVNISFSKGIYFKEDREFIFNELPFKTGDETDYKDMIRGYIYDALCDYSGRELPWGNLTGIRPTKLYLNRLLKTSDGGNISSDDIDTVISDMERIHRVGPAKGRLAVDIALREKGLIDSMHTKDGYSVYVGIPFCPSTCLYCSFTSNPIFSYKDRVGKYLNCLKKELEATASLMKDYILDTIYIGGGTPTTLEPEELEILLNDIVTILPMENVREFTVEAGRPDSITRAKLETIRKYPVTRISINPQTMKDETLKIIGRHHNVCQVVEAFNLARELGFDNINMDMILGLPGENEADVEMTIKRIEELAPESLTVHSLAVKRTSRLKEWLATHQDVETMDFDKAMEIASKGSKRMGMKSYYLYRQKDMGGNLENTGFALDGKYGLYNVLMMEEVQTIIACGAGTVTKRVYGDGRIERCDNVKDVGLYIEKIDEMIERKRTLFSDEN